MSDRRLVHLYAAAGQPTVPLAAAVMGVHDVTLCDGNTHYSLTRVPRDNVSSLPVGGYGLPHSFEYFTSSYITLFPTPDRGFSLLCDVVYGGPAMPIAEHWMIAYVAAYEEARRELVQ